METGAEGTVTLCEQNDGRADAVRGSSVSAGWRAQEPFRDWKGKKKISPPCVWGEDQTPQQASSHHSRDKPVLTIQASCSYQGEAQTHSMIRVGRDLWRSLVQPPTLSRTSINCLAPYPTHNWLSQDGDCPSLYDPVVLFDPLHRTIYFPNI